MRKVALVLSLACALSLSAGESPWDKLLRGNRTFRGDAIRFTGLNGLRDHLANGQNPAVTVLSCSDSRVPPELVFHQNLGDIFLVRSAGNVTDQFGIASIEYAIKKKWTKLLVIVAHEKCGAVEEAMIANGDLPTIPVEPTDPEEMKNLVALVTHIKKSFDGPCPNPKECWVYRTHENAIHTIADLKERSKIIRKAIDEHHVKVAVVFYKLDGHLRIWQEP